MTEKDAIEKLIFKLQAKGVIGSNDETEILNALKKTPQEKAITLSKDDKGYHCNAVVPEDQLEDFLIILEGVLKK